MMKKVPPFILATSSFDTNFGALAPTTSTAPITMSASIQASSRARAEEATYSAAKKGPLVAYRWNGEPTLTDAQFVQSRN